METLRRPLLARAFPAWAQQPIPNLSLSAGGLIALADLSTVANRTAIAGGSSWLDSLLLAPGLHYQQAADAVIGPALAFGAAEADGSTAAAATYAINNAATLRYIQAVARRPGAGDRAAAVALDVGMLRALGGGGGGRQRTATAVWRRSRAPDLGWLSEVLYLLSPLLTVVAFVLMVLLRDWWGIGLLGGLMLSRILNIWVIKQRAARPKTPQLSDAKPVPGPVPHAAAPPPAHHPRQPTNHPTPSPPSPSSVPTIPLFSPSPSPSPSPAPSLLALPPRLTTLHITLPDGRAASLRGMSDDLHAVTADAWLRAASPLEGYLEAAAKLVVFLVAALSGNQCQAGSLVLMALLVCSAGLLALSNAHAKGVRMNGRVVARGPVVVPVPVVSRADGGGGGQGRRRSRRGTDSAVYTAVEGRRAVAGGDSGGGHGWLGVDGKAMEDDWAEKGQGGHSTRQ